MATALERLSLSQLVAVYNACAVATGGPDVGKFSDMDTAIRRTEMALERAGLVCVPHLDSRRRVQFRLMPPDALPLEGDARVIRVLVHNPKAIDSASWHRFAIYRDGMTVGEYAARVGDRDLATLDLKWDARHMFIEILTRHLKKPAAPNGAPAPLGKDESVRRTKVVSDTPAARRAAAARLVALRSSRGSSSD